MALRQEFALSEASSPGGEENAIEVPDDSDEEQEHQLNQRDTRRESSGERDMAQERATNSDDESGEVRAMSSIIRSLLIPDER
jgi:hypothetical protein